MIPKQFDDAIRLLETLRQCIVSLKTLLDASPNFYQAIATFLGDIGHQFTIIIDQIDNHLIPSFERQIQGDCSQLKYALNKIDQYFPEKG